ncbi:MAG: IS1634 family transposase, partial [bacterium]
GLAQAGLPPGHLVWDRALTSREHVREVRDAQWHLIAGLSRSLKEVKHLLDHVQVPTTHHTYAKRTRNGGAAYAVATTAKLWGPKQEEVPVVVYVNNDKATRDLNERQEGLTQSVQVLEALNRDEATRSLREGELRKRVRAITGPWGRFLRVRIRRGGKQPRLVVSYRERELAAEARRDGKGVILSTDPKVGAQEVVREYFAKDDVEKVFRTLKSDVEVEPVRHRLEWRVRAYVLVNLLAYRLEAALRWLLAQAGAEEPHKEVEAFLRDLERVERVPVRFGDQERTWYLNVNDRIRKNLKRLGYGDVLREEVAGRA